MLAYLMGGNNKLGAGGHSLQLAAGGGHVDAAEVDGTIEQTGDTAGGATLERHVFVIRAGLGAEQDPQEVAGRPHGDAGRNLTGPGFGVGQQIRKAFVRRMTASADDLGRIGQQSDRFETVPVKVGDAVDEVDDDVLMDGEQGAAIGFRLERFFV